ncbi:MAG: response regulator transcription factor [Alphaproteobacteria bacterium]|nr:response regulator transcription factor [Alphaproteobacteria bacterium]
MPSTRVFLVDDHALVRAGIRVLLESAGMQVVGEAGSSEQAMRELPEAVDVVVADLSLDGANGLELLKGLAARDPDLPVLILSMHDETLYAERAIQAGARGYLMKDAAPEHLRAAIEIIGNGRIYLSPAMTARALERLHAGTASSDDPLTQLSDRELEVFERLGQGLTTREVADALHLSVKTVESHLSNIRKKLGARNTRELVRQAVLHVASL